MVDEFAKKLLCSPTRISRAEIGAPDHAARRLGPVPDLPGRRRDVSRTMQLATEARQREDSRS
jgi:hypothetical protein